MYVPQRSWTQAVGVLQKQYKVYSGESLKERQDEAIAQVKTILGLSAEDAGRLLRYYKW